MHSSWSSHIFRCNCILNHFVCFALKAKWCFASLFFFLNLIKTSLSIWRDSSWERERKGGEICRRRKWFYHRICTALIIICKQGIIYRLLICIESIILCVSFLHYFAPLQSICNCLQIPCTVQTQRNRIKWINIDRMNQDKCVFYTNWMAVWK